jgi:hypothetical protein
MDTMYRLFVSFEVTSLEQWEDWSKRIVEAGGGDDALAGAGTGFGMRDMDFSYSNEDEAEAAAERIQALGLQLDNCTVMEACAECGADPDSCFCDDDDDTEESA